MVLVGMLGVLVLVTTLSVKLVKGTKSSDVKVASEKVIQTSQTNSKKNKEKKSDKASLFDQEQVVSDHVFPVKDLNTQQVSEDKLPKGTVVTVKPVKGEETWVEIVSDPPKGFIEKNI